MEIYVTWNDTRYLTTVLSDYKQGQRGGGDVSFYEKAKIHWDTKQSIVVKAIGFF